MNKKKIHWISVNDGLPKSQDRVLIYGKQFGTARYGQYDMNSIPKWFDFDENGYQETYEVTDWAHITYPKKD